MEKKCSGVIATVVILLVLVSTGISQAVPTNGNFSDGLNYWNPGGSVENGDGETTGFAFFNSEKGSGSLSQEFILPDDAMNLSFEIKPLGQNSPGCDTFAVSLTGHTNYYFWSSQDGGTETTGVGVEVDPIVVNNEPWKRVILDVKSLAGNAVTLSFDFLSDNDELLSWVSLDNVVVTGSATVVPAPTAMILGTIGAGLVGLIRRTKILR